MPAERACRERDQLTHHNAPAWVAGLGDQLARLGPPSSVVDDLPGLSAQLDDEVPAILLATPVVPSRYGSRYAHGHHGLT